MSRKRPLLKTMTSEERLALIYKGFVPVQVVHAVKRWAGVYVNDNFGEGLSARLLRQIENQRLTKYDGAGYGADYAEWERIADGDENL